MLVAVIALLGFVFAPRAVFALSGAEPPRRATALPWIAAALFVVAFFLPNPDLEATDSFTRHVVGGGAACALLGHFFAINVGMRSPVLRVGTAYVVASALGVATELGELFAEAIIGPGPSRDSSWDLFANSIGAIGVAVAIELYLLVRPSAAPL